MHVHLCSIKSLGITTTPVSSDGEEVQIQYSLSLESYDGSKVSIGEFTKARLREELTNVLEGLLE